MNLVYGLGSRFLMCFGIDRNIVWRQSTTIQDLMFRVSECLGIFLGLRSLKQRHAPMHA
jgi:hypothetical protein